MDVQALAAMLAVCERTARDRLAAWFANGGPVKVERVSRGGRPAYVADPASLRAYLAAV